MAEFGIVDAMLSINDCCGCLGLMSSVDMGYVFSVVKVCG